MYSIALSVSDLSLSPASPLACSRSLPPSLATPSSLSRASSALSLSLAPCDVAQVALPPLRHDRAPRRRGHHRGGPTRRVSVGRDAVLRRPGCYDQAATAWHDAMSGLRAAAQRCDAAQSSWRRSALTSSSHPCQAARSHQQLARMGGSSCCIQGEVGSQKTAGHSGPAANRSFAARSGSRSCRLRQCRWT